MILLDFTCELKKKKLYFDSTGITIQQYIKQHLVNNTRDYSII